MIFIVIIYVSRVTIEFIHVPIMIITLYKLMNVNICIIRTIVIYSIN